jgi:hypothetical protein
MRRQLTIWSGLAIASCVVLGGCGSSEPDRTSGGVATGAGTGAVIGLIGGPIGVVVGAAVGAGAGALTATNTSPQSVNLGDPLWAHSPGVTAPPGVVGQSAPGSGPYGGMPPPQPLESTASYGTPAQTPAPSPGGTPMPPGVAIQSQSLPPSR